MALLDLADMVSTSQQAVAKAISGTSDPAWLEGFESQVDAKKAIEAKDTKLRKVSAANEAAELKAVKAADDAAVRTKLGRSNIKTNLKQLKPVQVGQNEAGRAFWKEARPSSKQPFAVITASGEVDTSLKGKVLKRPSVHVRKTGLLLTPSSKSSRFWRQFKLLLPAGQIHEAVKEVKVLRALSASGKEGKVGKAAAAAAEVRLPGIGQRIANVSPMKGGIVTTPPPKVGKVVSAFASVGKILPWIGLVDDISVLAKDIEEGDLTGALLHTADIAAGLLVAPEIVGFMIEHQTGIPNRGGVSGVLSRVGVEEETYSTSAIQDFAETVA